MPDSKRVFSGLGDSHMERLDDPPKKKQIKLNPKTPKGIQSGCGSNLR